MGDSLPIELRIELLMEIARTCIDRGDRDKARELVAEAVRLVDKGTWLPEHEVPMLAGLAALEFDAGDEEGARGGRRKVQAAARALV